MHCVVLFRRISSSTSKRKKIRPSRGGITFRIVLSPPTATTSMRTIRGALVAAQTIRTVIACERVGVATGWAPGISSTADIAAHPGSHMAAQS
ncbi:hypothetical protein NJB18091_39040 [Mycobacterium marinum]|nr:hypothetical protein NJB18091_39040 [Mycobacterium marinum]